MRIELTPVASDDLASLEIVQSLLGCFTYPP